MLLRISSSGSASRMTRSASFPVSTVPISDSAPMTRAAFFVAASMAVAGEQPSEIRAVGVPVLTDKVDLCHAWIEFHSGLVANLTASRVSAERIRKLRLFARDSYFSVDYADQTVSSVQLQRTGGDPQIVPRMVEVAQQEPLKAELEAFIAACRNQRANIVDGRTGAAALAAAIRIRESVEGR